MLGVLFATLTTDSSLLIGILDITRACVACNDRAAMASFSIKGPISCRCACTFATISVGRPFSSSTFSVDIPPEIAQRCAEEASPASIAWVSLSWIESALDDHLCSSTSVTVAIWAGVGGFRAGKDGLGEAMISPIEPFPDTLTNLSSV